MESRTRLGRWHVILGAGFCITTATSCQVSLATEPQLDGALPDTGGTTRSGESDSGDVRTGGTSGTQSTNTSAGSGGASGSAGDGTGGASTTVKTGTGGAQGGAGDNAGSGGRDGATGGAASDARPRDASLADTTAGAGGTTGTSGGDGAPADDAGVNPDGPVYAYGAAVENTSADCPIPTLPDGKSLTTKTTGANRRWSRRAAWLVGERHLAGVVHLASDPKESTAWSSDACEERAPCSSGAASRKPTPRTVFKRSAAVPSLSRSRLMCVSTVRLATSGW